MKTINYLLGDATRPTSSGNKIITHICNDIGAWGKGFVLALSKLYPEPERAYRDWYAMRKQNDFALGAVQFVSVSPEIVIAKDLGSTASEKRATSLRFACERLKRHWKQSEKRRWKLTLRFICRASAAASAGGEWNKIEPLIKKKICDKGVTVFVYDLV